MIIFKWLTRSTHETNTRYDGVFRPHTIWQTTHISISTFNYWYQISYRMLQFIVFTSVNRIQHGLYANAAIILRLLNTRVSLCKLPALASDPRKLKRYINSQHHSALSPNVYIWNIFEKVWLERLIKHLHQVSLFPLICFNFIIRAHTYTEILKPIAHLSLDGKYVTT